MPAEVGGRYNPKQVAKYPETWLKRATYQVVSLYLHKRHNFTARIHPETPREGPVFALSNHASLLDVPSLVIGDPYYPANIPVIDQEQFKNLIFKLILRTRGAIPIERNGRDMGAIRKLYRIFDNGGAACLAAEGVRTRTGHLWPMDEAAVGLTLRIASRGVPVCPIVVIGGYECLPPGVSWLKTKAGPIEVVSGPPIDLSQWIGKKKLSKDELKEPAGAIQTALADLLPPHYKPLPGTPAMWTRNDYQPLRSMKARSRDEIFTTFQESISVAA